MDRQSALFGERHGRDSSIAESVELVTHRDQMLLAGQSHQVSVKDQYDGVSALLGQRPRKPSVIGRRKVSDLFALLHVAIVASTAARRALKAEPPSQPVRPHWSKGTKEPEIVTALGSAPSTYPDSAHEGKNYEHDDDDPQKAHGEELPSGRAHQTSNSRSLRSNRWNQLLRDKRVATIEPSSA